MKHLLSLLLISCLLSTADTAIASTRPVLCFRSTKSSYWRMSVTHTDEHAIGTASMTINSKKALQTFKGWGTCFNELPWDAYNLMSNSDRVLFAQRVFNPLGDLKLTVGRIPVGASDYARGWYSCDETTGDFTMSKFTIDRDLQTVIPSIKVAQEQNPDMMFWASPWSPPQWMKINHHYAQRKTSTNGCPFNVPPYFNDQFIDSDRYYNAYCLYFDKFIQAYAEHGIPITALAYQNEAYSNTPYPGCSWTAKTTGKFLGKYLGPYMAKHQPNVKLIVGTMNTGSLDVYEQILNSEDVGRYCKQIGFQWEGGKQIHEVMARHPQYEAVMTESECGSGTFDWGAAVHTFQLVNHYLANGVTTYSYWNAILKDKGLSTWGWQQNALVQVNSSTGRPRYTAEYYALKHYSHFITPGSKILYVNESSEILAALTPAGAVVVVAGNSSDASRETTFDIDGQRLTTILPAHSFSTYVLADDDVEKQMLTDEAKGLMQIEKARLTTSQNNSLATALKLVTDNNVNALDSLLFAVANVECDSTSSACDTLRNASFTNGVDSWVLDNVASSGDFRTNTIAGRTCWNNWSNNFTSLGLHQDLSGLQPGVYTVSCLSMCGPGEITNQHAYAVAQTDTAISAVKKVAIWNTSEGWERQTTQPVVVGTDGKLRVGYASTSGGGTHGWFCVTDFSVTRCIDNEAAIVDSVLHNDVAKAKATGNEVLINQADEALRVTGLSARIEALTALRTSLSSYLHRPDLTAYRSEVSVAEDAVANDSLDAQARKQIEQLLRAQASLIDTLSHQTDVDCLTRQLHEAITSVLATRKAGSEDNLSFLIRNAGAESEDGWYLSVTNGDATRKCGQHYSGDKGNWYFDSYNATKGNLWYTGRQTLLSLPNGTYQLQAAARTDGDGVFVWAATDSAFYKSAVPNNGNAATAGSLGGGWNTVTVNNIIVSNNSLTIGFTNDMWLTGESKFTGTWFSVDDFRLTRLSSSVNTSIDGVKTKLSNMNACYRLDGVRVSQPAHGIFIVNGATRIL